MRVFEYKKIAGSAFNSTHYSWQIVSKHQFAKVEEIIGEVYDLQIAEAVTDFLNKREQEFETERAKRLFNRT
jgi:hypothetical protein